MRCRYWEKRYLPRCEYCNHRYAKNPYALSWGLPNKELINRWLVISTRASFRETALTIFLENWSERRRDRRRTANIFFYLLKVYLPTYLAGLAQKMAWYKKFMATALEDIPHIYLQQTDDCSRLGEVLKIRFSAKTCLHWKNALNISAFKRMNCIFLNGHLFCFIFSLFKQTIQFLQYINVKIVHSLYCARIRTHNLSIMSHLP